MLRASTVLALSSALLLQLAPSAGAQLGDPWVTFSKQPGQLGVAPLVLSNANTQVFFGSGDLDQDGWDDVVAVRKEPASLSGKRAAVLLMNVGGVLTDMTALHAAASDVPGDDGFLTPVNSRECELGDVDGDGWLDVVTSATLSDGDPKVISHPRVYLNLGEDGNGAWLGLMYENARIPQFKTVGGLSVAPRFFGIGFGDVTDDGSNDLFLTDYDTTETNISEPATWDLNDRLLVNDGNGFFTDQSATRLTATQLLSSFGTSTEIVDVNADGFMDIARVTTLSNPIAARLIYNNPANPGQFTAMGMQDINGGSPYSMDLGNLNDDAIIDAVIHDDGNDKFRLGTGYDGLNRVIWGPLKNFTFLNGADDGFGNNIDLSDLDGDGWNDVLITDVHGDLPGCNRRLHVYHNTGTVPGDLNLVIQEEVELASGNQGAGWKGAVGILSADVKGTYDVCAVDFDKDGDLDMLVGTCTGTRYFQNETNPLQVICQDDLGFAGPGDMVFSICGDDLTEAGSVATMELTGGVPNQPLFIPLALTQGPVPFKGGMLVPFPAMIIVQGLTTDGSGQFTAPVPGSAGADLHVYMQCIVKVGSVYEFSNGLDVVFGF